MTLKSISRLPRMMCSAALILLLAGAGVPPSAAAAGDAVALPPFQDGDTVLFTCDNINSMNGFYSQYISLFWLTRYPQIHVKFINGGFSESASDSLINRFDEDMAFWKPNYVVLMLGMNDIGPRLYKPDLPPEERETWRLQQFEAWSKERSDLVSKIELTLPRELVITSSRGNLESTLTRTPYWARQYLDADLGKIRDLAQILAAERKHPFLDWRSLMQTVARRELALDRKFSLAPDRNRPNPGGDLIMAYTFLQAQGGTPYYGEIILDLVADKPIKTQTALLVRDVTRAGNGVSFKYLPEALPFRLPGQLDKKYRRMLNALIPLDGHERLLILGLTGNLYRLMIDGRDCGRFTGAQLAQGIDFSTIPEAPSTQQVQEVITLHNQRIALETETARCWIDGKVRLKELRRAAQERKDEFPDEDAAAAFLMAEREKEPAQKAFWRKVAGLSTPEGLEKWQADLLNLDAQIYRVNQPVEHAVEIDWIE